MFKKVTKLLLALTLVLQIFLSHIVIVNANGGSVLTNVVLNDPTSESDEDDQESHELDEDNNDDSEDEDVESTEAEQDVETENVDEDEVELDDDEVDLDSSEEEEDEDETDDEDSPAFPQASIDAMRTFLAENSEENPFIIPEGSDFIEAINALDWGEGVTVSPVLTGYDALHGALALILNSELDEDEHTFDDEYWFFEVGVFVQYEGDEEEDEESLTIPQAAIDAMREFIEENSADNPLIIPVGLNFTEAINALDWGEGITVSPIMSSHGLESGSVRGSLFLHLNQQLTDDEVTYDDEYAFLDIVIYYENKEEAEAEKPASEPPPPAGQTPEQPPARVLPQTGTDMLNMSLIGGGILAVGGLLIYLKKRNKK